MRRLRPNSIVVSARTGPPCSLPYTASPPCLKAQVGAGVLYNRDGRLARELLMLLGANNELIVGDNAPYVVNDATDYTIPVHAERRGLYHALVEVRQDLIDNEIGQREWALRLGDLLPKAYESLR